ncbi:filamentous hemagglutinin N-terminal domain-containing protein [Campylobacter peloridis]|uniref:Filamentous hemagglutinin N-terminal domain-containing protein n=1 Tax=Campylobacter peloridis TaxID=488546 RepID=A0ABX6TR98_9BACT|nr:filamentous hemagglutinin N-terminal domain-containing protein [Campylobacter peloridis]QOQ88505.1 filamentous hemagglutinin N-terminal domain-containing protein [Campylobacter peloridis]
MLFSPLAAISPNALPSGGKFTHGTSGSININGNNMHITGTTSNKNHIIQWGGGFNIGKDAQVNFTTNKHNYLNIAHGTNKSTIAGILNAKDNNVFLINPNGVIITKTGNINANRFVASTSSMSNEDMNKFAKLNENQAGNFSPVFKPQKAGSVVNMGNINANDVLLIGHKVDIQGGKLGNTSSKTHLVGNYVYIDADSVKLNSNNINVTAIKDGYIQRQMINFAKDNYKFGNNVNINNTNYTETDGETHHGSSNFKKALTIGNMGNEKANAIEWWHFAKGWNENLNETRSIDEFRLVGNIDFDNKPMDPVAYDYKNAFNKTFDGNGYTLSNLLINTNKDYGIGLFGVVRKANIGNLNINTINFDYTNGIPSHIGTIANSITDSSFYNINISNIGDLLATGGNAIAVGGFAGMIWSGSFKNISIKNIKSMKVYSDEKDLYTAWIGGFAGTTGIPGYESGKPQAEPSFFENITISGIGNNVYAILVNGEYYRSHASIGGFIGAKYDDSYIKNVSIFFDKNYQVNAEGFVSHHIGKLYGYNVSGYLEFDNVHIYHHENDLANAIADKNYWGNTNDKIQIHTYTDKTQANAYKDFLSRVNIINSDVILTSDDLHQDIIQGIIDSIRNEKYTIDIKNLYSLIQAFKGLNKDSNENEIKTIVKTHLGIKDDDKALSIAQSISFLLHYNEINFNNKLDKTALELYNNQIKPNVFNTLEIITYLDTNKNNIIAQLQQYESIKNDFKIKEQAYFKAQAEFNKLLDLVNKGKLNYNDPKFTQAFDNWTKAYNAYNSLSNDIGELNSKVNQYTQYINTTLGYKQFAFVKFDNIIKTDLTKPILPDIDNSLGGDKQPVFEQTASLNLIGDNAIEEEEEKKEIEETALTQRARTCIVSDNFKTMNPCVVESY